MNIDEIPVPPGANQGTIDGGYEVKLDAATNAILVDLKKDHSKVSEKILFLPADADAAKIFAFYEPKMSEKGFSQDANVPPQSVNYQIKVWRNDGWIGGEAVAVAVIDAGNDSDSKPIKFLAIFQAEK
ncbi:MAG: hypothetical protein ABIP06_05605 [Pyrinomonadaceae bacterium]